MNETIVALATPPGVGAIAIIRLSGPDAWHIVNKIFSKDITNAVSHTIHFGKIIDTHSKETIDEVLVSLFKSPNSYTGEHVVEISCHGSSYIIQQLMQLCIKHGARSAKPGEFTLRAFINGKLDLSQAEAVADLIAAQSRMDHKVAMNQMKGRISNEISLLRQDLIDFASLIELELDFSEEDVEFADRQKLKTLVEQIQLVIQRLKNSFTLGNAIKSGISAVIAGRPNAGKSTLLNMLLQEERAIVSEIAGTTRDTLEEILNINGIRFRLIDTAGLRDTQDEIEAIGVERTIQKIHSSAIVLYLFDVSNTSPHQLQEDLHAVMSDKYFDVTLLCIANKMDLNPYARVEDYIDHTYTFSHNILPISAKNNMNIEYLKQKLYSIATNDQELGDQTIISSARHYEALLHCDESLQNVIKGLLAGVSGDFIAMDIRQCLHYLGEISGEISSEDLLDSIFSRFCIGK